MIRLLIVTDIRLYRDGLTEILRRDPELASVGAAASEDEALRLVESARPDIVLIDLSLLRSPSTVRAIRLAASNTKIVALAVPDSEAEVVACAEAGIDGYVPREASLADLVATLQSVVRGELLCSPRVAASLLRRVTALALVSGPATADGLTARELEIADLLESGFSNKDIARELCIEVATVKNHVHHILEKLHVHRRGQAAARVRAAPHPPTPRARSRMPG